MWANGDTTTEWGFEITHHGVEELGLYEGDGPIWVDESEALAHALMEIGHPIDPAIARPILEALGHMEVIETYA